MTWLLAGGTLLTVAVLIGLLHRPLGDYLAFVYTTDKDLRIDAAGVHMSPSARRASDHLPIWARLSA